jgi:hypothetical protein
MADLLRLATFVAFLALGALVVRTSGAARRRAVNALIAYVLAIHALLLAARSDDWPFTLYPLIVKLSDGNGDYRKITFFGVDAAGREWAVDPDAWSPVSPPVLMQWFVSTFPRLSDSDRGSAKRFLLHQADARRAAIVARSRAPKRSILGPLAAPDWWDYARPAAVSPTPFVALRVYEEHFRPRERMAGVAGTRTLLLDGR